MAIFFSWRPSWRVRRTGQWGLSLRWDFIFGLWGGILFFVTEVGFYFWSLRWNFIFGLWGGILFSVSEVEFHVKFISPSKGNHPWKEGQLGPGGVVKEGHQAARGEVSFIFGRHGKARDAMVVCCQVTKQLEQTESDKRAQEQELEKKGRELFKTQVYLMSKNPLLPCKLWSKISFLFQTSLAATTKTLEEVEKELVRRDQELAKRWTLLWNDSYTWIFEPFIGRQSWWRWKTSWRSRRRRGRRRRRGGKKFQRWEYFITKSRCFSKLTSTQIKRKPGATSEEERMKKRMATRRGSLPGQVTIPIKIFTIPILIFTIPWYQSIVTNFPIWIIFFKTRWAPWSQHKL